MNLLQLRNLLRLRLDDDKVAPYRWSDSELDDYINQAVIEAAIRSRFIVDSTTAACCIIAVVAGVAEYALHPAIFQLRRVFDSTNKKTLCKTGFAELDASENNWQSKTGNPTHFINDLNHYGDNNSITLYPTPESDLTLNLTAYRVPLADLVLDEDVPEIPAFHHRNLIYWALSLAYMKQDADTLNADKSLDFERKFEKCFGEYQDARKLEWRRKHKSVQTTGRYF